MKPTKKTYFAILAEMVNNSDRADKSELSAFIAHEIALLNKRAENRTPTAKQRAKQCQDEQIKRELISALTSIGSPVTVSELQTRAPSFAEYSVQKLTPLLHALEDAGAVKRVVDKKRRTVFSIMS